MKTPAEVIAHLNAELASWEMFLARNEACVKGFKFNTKSDARRAEIAIADIKYVVEGKRNRLNEYLAKV